MASNNPSLLNPKQAIYFTNLQEEGKQLSSEGKLIEALEKFELALSICETSKIKGRILKLKAHIGMPLNGSSILHQESTLMLADKDAAKFNKLKSEGKRLAEEGNFHGALSKLHQAEGISQTMKVKKWIKKLEGLIQEESKAVTDPQNLTPESHKHFKKLKLDAMKLSLNGNFKEALELFQQAMQLCESPDLLEYVKNIKKMMAKHAEKLETFQNLADKGQKLLKEGNNSESLKVLKEAYSVCPSPHVLKSIQTLTVAKDKGTPVIGTLSDSVKKSLNFQVIEQEANCDSAESNVTVSNSRSNQSNLKHFLKSNVEDESPDEGDKMIEVCDGFSVYHEIYNKLYPYQRDGVAWMWQLHKKKKGGVLGDDMGLGKTFQVIAFLSGVIDADYIKNILIIMPVSLLENWKREFNKWCPGILVHEFHGGSKKQREKNLNRVQRRGNVLLTSYGMVVSSQESFIHMDGRQFVWDYVILDEGHKIKNPTKTTKAVHEIPSRNRIVLTGTPVQNNLRELWALYDFSHQGALLGSLKTFKMQYENIITRSREKDATAGEKRLGTEMAENLKRLIKPYFLRRTKSEVLQKKTSSGVDDLSNALNNLNITNKMTLDGRKNDLIIWLKMNDAQVHIYSDFLQSDSVKTILMTKKSPLVQLTVLKKICDHPRLLSKKACLQLGLNGEMSEEDLLAEIEDDSTSASSIENVSDETLLKESAKLEFVIDLLENLCSGGHRTLVFSLSLKILDMIQRILTNKKWKVLRIDGTIKKMEERERRIQLFQNDSSCQVFLLTTQVGGVGITLTAADRVVIYDPSWNPATDAQAVDRVYRIGQRKNVVVYRLITCGTVEEKIYRRQIFKDSITRQATTSSDPHRYFSKQELRELFSIDDPNYSSTQVQLSRMHSDERQTDTSLDAHIAFLHSLDIFGISDHDLMFSKEIQDESEDVDQTAISHDYIRKTVDAAQQIIQAEALVVEEGIRLAGKYSRPYLERIPTFKKNSERDRYKPPMFPEVIDLTLNGESVRSPEHPADNINKTPPSLTESAEYNIDGYSPVKEGQSKKKLARVPLEALENIPIFNTVNAEGSLTDKRHLMRNSNLNVKKHIERTTDQSIVTIDDVESPLSKNGNLKESFAAADVKSPDVKEPRHFHSVSEKSLSGQDNHLGLEEAASYHSTENAASKNPKDVSLPAEEKVRKYLESMTKEPRKVDGCIDSWAESPTADLPDRSIMEQLNIPPAISETGSFKEQLNSSPAISETGSFKEQLNSSPAISETGSFKEQLNIPPAISETGSFKEQLNSSPAISETGSFKEQLNSSPAISETGSFKEQLNIPPAINETGSFKEQLNSSPAISETGSFKEQLNSSPAVSEIGSFRSDLSPIHDTLPPLCFMDEEGDSPRKSFSRRKSCARRLTVAYDSDSSSQQSGGEIMAPESDDGSFDSDGSFAAEREASAVQESPSRTRISVDDLSTTFNRTPCQHRMLSGTPDRARRITPLRIFTGHRSPFQAAAFSAEESPIARRTKLKAADRVGFRGQFLMRIGN